MITLAQACDLERLDLRNTEEMTDPELIATLPNESSQVLLSPSDRSRGRSARWRSVAPADEVLAPL